MNDLGLSYSNIEPTQRREDATREANEGKGFDCTLCADSGLKPAPEPYGSMGCVWECHCDAGTRLRAEQRRRWFFRHVSLMHGYRVADQLGIPRKHAAVPE